MRLFKNKVALSALAFLVAFPVLLSNDAFSHGDAPSTCENRYDAEIISMTLDNGMQMFDPISDPDLEFAAQIDEGYDVTFILHTANASSLNNTLSGTTWYRHSAYGFGSGACVDSTGPDQDISVTLHVGAPSGVPDGYQQNIVEWGSWPDVVQFIYGVTWHSEPGEEQQNDTQSAPPERLADDHDVGDNEPKSDEEEFEDDDSGGTILSPFIFRGGEEISVSATEAGDLIEEGQQPSLEAVDTLYINGTLTSNQFLNGTEMLQLHILSGNWSMAMNDTAATAFNANFTVVRSDGTGRQTFSLGNLTAVDGTDMSLTNGTISMSSVLDYHTNGTITTTNVTITVLKLDTITIELDGMHTPIYGVVDKVMRFEGGQMQVMARQFDMI